MIPDGPPSNSGAAANYSDDAFPALRLARIARFIRRLGTILLITLLVITASMVFAPWQQSIRGEGAVVARDPGERTQEVMAQLKGLVKERGAGIQEAAYVEKGQLLFRLVDQNPLLQEQLDSQIANTEREIEYATQALENLDRVIEANQLVVDAKREEIEFLEVARDAIIEANQSYVEQARNKLQAAERKLLAFQAKLEYAEAEFRRKQSLFDKGLESQKNFQDTQQKYRDAQVNVEVANIEIESARNELEGKQQELDSKQREWDAKITKVRGEMRKSTGEVSKTSSEARKLAGEINQKSNKLLDIRGKEQAQRLQSVVAPVSGYIMDLKVVEGMNVKPGDALCRVVPKTEDYAVQIWVAGNDAPLIAPGRHVRLQFEGWPAVQFSGWPSVAVGTFGGQVLLVDPTDDGKGRFRVVVVPDPESPPWPDYPYLRQGVRSYGWVLLNEVPLGYEIWRRMNGFPPSFKSEEKAKTAKPPKIKI